MTGRSVSISERGGKTGAGTHLSARTTPRAAQLLCQQISAAAQPSPVPASLLLFRRNNALLRSGTTVPTSKRWQRSTRGLHGCRFFCLWGWKYWCFAVSRLQTHIGRLATCPVLAASPQLATSSRCVQVRNVWMRPVCCKKSRKKFYLNVSTHVSRNASVKPSRALAIFIQETTIHLC